MSMDGAPGARTVVLWDIDNTLLYTGGAGALGMTRAFHELYGVADGFAAVEFSGRTDTAIFRDAARAHRLACAEDAAELSRFIDRYIDHLSRALHEVRGALMPGVAGALAALAACDDVVQALGTGNFRPGAALKLRHYGIDGYFPGTPGGFGEDDEAREQVIRAAIERVAGVGARVVVIGDTPHDITAAKANGAMAVGVASGRNSVDELAGSGADAVFEDLRDTERLLAAVRGVAR